MLWSWSWCSPPLPRHGQDPASQAPLNVHPFAPRANRLFVTPDGPEDGGDFGPRTPGTKTSGLQEAFDAAKARGMDLYIAGGSWTAEKTRPIVYVLHETLRIPVDAGLSAGQRPLRDPPRPEDRRCHRLRQPDELLLSVWDSGFRVERRHGAAAARPRLARTASRSSLRRSSISTHWWAGEARGREARPITTHSTRQHRWIGTGLWLDATDGPDRRQQDQRDRDRRLWRGAATVGAMHAQCD